MSMTMVSAWVAKKNHRGILATTNISVAGWFSDEGFSSTDRQKSHQINLCPPIFILIPAYNEEERILSTLKTYQDFLLQSNWTDAHILVVDDGSTDETCKVVESFSPKKIPISCISLSENQGKGAALAEGISHIDRLCQNNAALILTQDADGSGNLVYLDSMIHCLKGLLAENMDEESAKESSFWSQAAMVTGNRNYEIFSPRGITRWGFQTAVRLIMNDLRVQDSQCGYKLMTLSAARDLYDELEVSGWAHDVEVLYRAKLVSIPIQEIPIDWLDKEGSKVVESGVARVSIQMLLDVIRLRWRYSNIRAWLNVGAF